MYETSPLFLLANPTTKQIDCTDNIRLSRLSREQLDNISEALYDIENENNYIINMSSDQSPLNEARGAGTTFGPTSGDSQKGTSAGTVGSNSAAGSGSHPSGDRDDSNASLTGMHSTINACS